MCVSASVHVYLCVCLSVAECQKRPNRPAIKWIHVCVCVCVLHSSESSFLRLLIFAALQ